MWIYGCKNTHFPKTDSRKDKFFFDGLTTNAIRHGTYLLFSFSAYTIKKNVNVIMAEKT